MFDFLRRKKTPETEASETSTNQPVETAVQATPPPKAAGFFSKLKQGLKKTRHSFSNGLANLFLGKKILDRELINEIEIQLITADVGVETTEVLIKSLTDKLARNELNDSQAAFQCLQTEMKAMLKPCTKPLQITDKKPYVILVVGVNGSGKTTTIGKMAHYFKGQGKSLMLAAGDTFRAAAVEQLTEWGHRNQVPVIAQQPGADTAAVIFDALAAAKARQTDVLIADTAGRLHTQSNLMAELQKIKRVLTKLDPEAPHEILIVLDAGIGQNALNQVRQFNEAVGVSGIVLTKLDGTAKGGILFALAKETGIPIKFIGIGEGMEDLRPFNGDDFVNALFQE